jgi:hypothetical protein
MGGKVEKAGGGEYKWKVAEEGYKWKMKGTGHGIGWLVESGKLRNVFSFREIRPQFSVFH